MQALQAILLRVIPVLIVLHASCMAGGTSTNKELGADRKEIATIKQRLAAWDHAWLQGDAHALATYYASDTEWRAFGVRKKGRTEIEKYLREFVAQPGFATERYKISETSVELLRRNLARSYTRFTVVQTIPGSDRTIEKAGQIIRLLNLKSGSWAIVWENITHVSHVVDVGIPVIGSCGGIGASCCRGTAIVGNLPQSIEFCDGTNLCTAQQVCGPGPPPTPCGGLGQECCKDPNGDDPNYDFCSDSATVCFSWLGAHGTCEACGGIGQAPCIKSQSCQAGAVARNGACVACGQSGQPCCRNGCAGGGVCSADANFTCTGCGGDAQPVCSDGTCHGDNHPNVDEFTNQFECSSLCGHTHQVACRVKKDAGAGAWMWVYSCYDHNFMVASSANLPVDDPEGCLCQFNDWSQMETDTSGNNGTCKSTNPPPPSHPGPPA